MKFLHLSDLHIHTNDKDNQEAKATLDFIKEKYPDHFLIVTGDITDDGSDHQYRNAQALLTPFQGRIFVCPGNHDFGAMGNFYSEERAQRFDRYLSIPLNQGGTFKGDTTPVVNVLKDNQTQVMLIAMDTNLETEHPFDFACGEVGESQRRALKTILSTAGNRDLVKILFFHHHPFVVNNPFMEMKDAQDLARAIYARVDVVLFGHKHEMNAWRNTWGITHLLASDNSPGKNFAREITVDGTSVSIAEKAIA